MTRIAHCWLTAWLPNDRWNRRLTPVCRRALNQTLPDPLRLTRLQPNAGRLRIRRPRAGPQLSGVGNGTRLRMLAANASNSAVSMLKSAVSVTCGAPVPRCSPSNAGISRNVCIG